MALQNYLTLADITHAKLSQYPDTKVQLYIDEANDHYEERAAKLGVTAESIAFPVDILVKTYLKNYILMRFGADNMGMVIADDPEDDPYKIMYKAAKVSVNEDIHDINAYIILGTAGTDPVAHSSRTARRHRTA